VDWWIGGLVDWFVGLLVYWWIGLLVNDEQSPKLKVNPIHERSNS
jgi:hypothetical protein